MPWFFSLEHDSGQLWFVFHLRYKTWVTQEAVQAVWHLWGAYDKGTGSGIRLGVCLQHWFVPITVGISPVEPQPCPFRDFYPSVPHSSAGWGTGWIKLNLNVREGMRVGENNPLTNLWGTFIAIIYRSLWGIHIVLYHLTLFGSLVVPAKKNKYPKPKNPPPPIPHFWLIILRAQGVSKSSERLSLLSANNLWLKGTRAWLKLSS